MAKLINKFAGTPITKSDRIPQHQKIKFKYRILLGISTLINVSLVSYLVYLINK